MALLIHPCLGHAATRTDELKRCLADFDGIQWQLPYQPPVDIDRCSTPTVGYNSHKAPEGRRRLELINSLTLGPDDGASDESYAALQEAVLAHFDALFVRRGYRRVAVEYGNARTIYYRGPLHRENYDGPPAPPIPYIDLARYVRHAGDGDVTLTFMGDAKNTWVITIEGLPASAGGRP